ncbi:MAG: glutathione S-transferase family protein, partial [Proteobacteria bacterium]|nr:glutathione S-transferase family protein [Pseudomonadota bacterium]
MSNLICVIGNKNYSSWSLRPWLMLRHYGVEFQEIRIALFEEGFREKLAPYSPTSKVPVIVDGKDKIWDSLAICEYISDKFLAGKGWPSDLTARGHARSASAEMHSGFMHVRSHLPMNCRKIFENFEIKPDVQGDIDRIAEVWKESRKRFGSAGPWLYGEFSIADCMFAPVVLRFKSYQVKLDNELTE